jgi:ribonuclease P protein component
VFIAAPNEADQVRIGVVAGRSLGNAVLRNRAKRRLRASLAQHLDHLQGGWDLVFLARKPMDQASFDEIQMAVRMLLKRAGLLND